MHGSTEAGDDEKVAGIVEQVRADSQLREGEDVEPLLRQRLDETGIRLSEEEIARHLDDIRNGPSVVD